MQNANIEPIAVRLSEACRLLGCGMTRLYQLINGGEIETFLDGGSRKAVYGSLQAYVERQRAKSSRSALLKKRVPKSARRSKEEILPEGT